MKQKTIIALIIVVFVVMPLVMFSLHSLHRKKLLDRAQMIANNSSNEPNSQ